MIQLVGEPNPSDSPPPPFPENGLCGDSIHPRNFAYDNGLYIGPELLFYRGEPEVIQAELALAAWHVRMLAQQYDGPSIIWRCLPSDMQVVYTGEEDVHPDIVRTRIQSRLVGLGQSFGRLVVGYSTNGDGKTVLTGFPSAEVLSCIVDRSSSHPIIKNLVDQPIQRFGFGYYFYVDALSGHEFTKTIIFPAEFVSQFNIAATFEINFTGPESPYYMMHSVSLKK